MVEKQSPRTTSKTGKLEREIISIVGPNRWKALTQDVLDAFHSGDGSNSDLDGKAMRIHRRSVVLTVIDNKLKDLNSRFPGEKQKIPSEQNLLFLKDHKRLLKVKRDLAAKQKKERKDVRSVLEYRESTRSKKLSDYDLRKTI